MGLPCVLEMGSHVDSAHWHHPMPWGLYGGVSAQMACVHGRESPGVEVGQHLFALVHVVASDVAQDEDDPEEGHSTQHLHGYSQLARAQLLGDPRMRTASEPKPGIQGGSCMGLRGEVGWIRKRQAEVDLSALLEVGVTCLFKDNAQHHGHVGRLARAGLGQRWSEQWGPLACWDCTSYSMRPPLSWTWRSR